MCPATDKWINKMWYTYTMEYYSAIQKQWSYVVCKKMDGTGDHRVERDKPSSERQTSHGFTHMWNLDIKNNITLSKWSVGRRN
jgi:hypothetical protein